MAVPSAPNVFIGGNHKWGTDGVASITTTPSESVTKVTAIISQTSGGAAIETVETSTKTSSDQFADRWALSWPTTGIASSPYYVRVRSTNADGNGPFKEIAPYIYFPPTVAITTPANGSTLTSASVTMAWTASDPYGISAQRVAVLHGADVLLDESVSESATSYAVPSSVAFLDGESYTFRVTARNGNGMEASADSTVSFSFIAPAAASATITDDGSAATIEVAFGDSSTATNLSPFFSQDLTDVYNSSTNPDGYWYDTNANTNYTRLTDGWAHFEKSNITATTNYYFRVKNRATLQPNTTYTALIELAHVSLVGGTYVQAYISTGTSSVIPSTGTGGFTGSGVLPAYYKQFTTGADTSSPTYLANGAVQMRGTAESPQSLSMDIRISFYEGEYEGDYVPYGLPATDSVDVARINADGTAWVVASGLADGATCIDPLPPLGVPCRYALTSHAAGGGAKVAYAEHTVETRAWHLNFGDAAQEHVSYLYNPQATMTLAQGGESYHFADGGAGRGLPVFYPTTDRDMSGTLKFDTVLYGDSDILLDLCDRYPVAWLRDPFGHRWRAHVRPSVSHGVGQAWPVTISWDAVRFEEA